MTRGNRLSPARLLAASPGTLLAVLTLLALALRLAWGLGALASEVALVDQGDYASYKIAAQLLLEHGDFNNSLYLVRPPAFPLLIALAGLNEEHLAYIDGEVVNAPGWRAGSLNAR